MYEIMIIKGILILTGVFCYLMIDEKFKITNKIYLKLNINKQWKAYLLAFIIFISGPVVNTTARLNGYSTNVIANLLAQELFLGLTMCLADRIFLQFTTESDK